MTIPSAQVLASPANGCVTDDRRDEFAWQLAQGAEHYTVCVWQQNIRSITYEG